MDDEIDRKIDVTAMQFLLVQNNIQQTYGWTLIVSGANGLGIQECDTPCKSWKAWFTTVHLKPKFDKKNMCKITASSWLKSV